MSILKNINLASIGRILVLVGIGLTISRWFFDLEVGDWAIFFLIPGVILTYVGEKTKKPHAER